MPRLITLRGQTWYCPSPCSLQPCLRPRLCLVGFRYIFLLVLDIWQDTYRLCYCNSLTVVVYGCWGNIRIHWRPQTENVTSTNVKTAACELSINTDHNPMSDEDILVILYTSRASTVMSWFDSLWYSTFIPSPDFLTVWLAPSQWSL